VANDRKSVFWLDYTGLEYGCFDEFMVLLSKVAGNSMVKITLRAEPKDYMDKAEEFRRRFDAIMPDPFADPPFGAADFATLIQGMVQIAAQKALPGSLPHVFQPVSSFYYSDGTGMLTLTGIVCPRGEQADVRDAFKSLKFANLDWARPKKIDVPVLSTKERLHLQRILPCAGGAGRVLRQELGYLIDKDRQQTEMKLKQYADFHRYFPYFVKATP